MRFRLFALVSAMLVVVLAPSMSGARTIEEAERLFARGDFLAASEVAADLDTAEGLALAARATLAYVDFIAPYAEQPDKVEAAERFARRSLAKDGNQVDAMFYLAIAIRYMAREKGAIVAHFQGLADKGRAKLDRAIELDPQNPWGYGLLGGWHLEVVRYAGSTLAAVFYDASVEDGTRLFEKALQMDPDNLLLHSEFALALLGLDPNEYGERAASHLQMATALTPANRVEELAQERSWVALEALETGDMRLVSREIERIKGTPKTLNHARPDRDSHR